MTLRLIADDLTGALDAAAPFASPEAPVRLVLSDAAPASGAKITFSTESRDLEAVDAVARAVRAYAALSTDAGALWFKKVDSVLRGHPLAETLAIARVGGFRRCVFAPAFPEMGRITRGGRQLVRTAEGAWSQTGPDDLARAFEALGASGIDVTVLDAETPEDLRRGAAPLLGQPEVLWAGSGGLARALVPLAAPLATPRVGLFILGTSHPVTRAQAALLRPHCRPLRAGDAILPSVPLPVLIDPVPGSRNAQETALGLAAALAGIVRLEDDRALVVTGGDCLSLVLRETAAEGLECIGEVGIGLPLSRIVGGRLAGNPIISKSGGFGTEKALRDLAVRVP